MGRIGLPEPLLILPVTLLILGPYELPDLARALGQAVRGFKQAVEEGKVSPVWRQASDSHIADGTPLPVQLLEFISSETSRPRDPIRFAIAQDLRIDGMVVLKRGTPVTGIVLEVTPYRLGRRWIWWQRARAGRLIFAFTDTHAVDGQRIRLRPLPIKQAATGQESGIVVGRTPRALLRWAHEGERFQAFVDGEYNVTRRAP